MAYLTKVYLLCLLSVCVVVFSRTDVSCKAVKSENNEMSSYQNFIRIGAYLPM
jgi:hypothetical protein